MSRYKELQTEMDNVKQEFVHVKEEILHCTNVIKKNNEDICNLDGPDDFWLRMEIMEKNRALREELTWWNERKDMLNERLHTLQEEICGSISESEVKE